MVKKGMTVSIEEEDFLYMEKVKRMVNGTSKRIGVTWATFIVGAVRMAYPEKTKEESIDDIWRVKR